MLRTGECLHAAERACILNLAFLAVTNCETRLNTHIHADLSAVSLQHILRTPWQVNVVHKFLRLSAMLVSMSRSGQQRPLMVRLTNQSPLRKVVAVDAVTPGDKVWEAFQEAGDGHGFTEGRPQAAEPHLSVYVHKTR